MRPRIATFAAALGLLASLVACPAQACARVGLEAGLNHSKATLTSGIGLPGPGYRPAWSAGVTLDMPAGPRFTLATGLRYLEYGEQVATIVSFVGGPDFERHLVWRYLAVPAHLRVHPLPAPGLYLAAGPEVGYLLTTWHQDHVMLTSSPVRPWLGVAVEHPQGEIFEEVGTFFADPHGAYSRWNLAFSGALGSEFPLAGHTGLVEARYTHGLVDIAKSAALERATRGFELLLGLRW